MSGLNSFKIVLNFVRHFFPAFLLLIIVDMYRNAGKFSLLHGTIAAAGLLIIMAARFTAPWPLTENQLKWFLADLAGGCLPVSIFLYVLFNQSVNDVLVISTELIFWSCLLRVCRLSLKTLGRLSVFLAGVALAVHQFVRCAVEGRPDLSKYFESLLTVGLVILLMAAIMLWFARLRSRSAT